MKFEVGDKVRNTSTRRNWLLDVTGTIVRQVSVCTDYRLKYRSYIVELDITNKTQQVKMRFRESELQKV